MQSGLPTPPEPARELDGSAADRGRTGIAAASRLDWFGVATVAFFAVLTLTRAADLFLVRLLRPDEFVGDLNQHVWWTARFADPGLFPNDIAAEFFSQPLVSPYGYQLIYRVLAPYVAPQSIAETIPIILTACVALLAYLAGRAASGSRAGGIVGTVFLLSWGEALDVLQSGLQRSFALPILMLGTWALMVRRHAFLGAALLLGISLYPPVFLNVAALAIVVLGWRWWKEGHAPESWRSLALGAGLALAVMLATRAQPWPADLGRQVTATEARAMPEFSPGGRLTVFFDDPIDFYVRGKLSGIDYGPWQLAGVAVLVLASVLVFPRLIRFEGWALVATSGALFLASHLLLFALYLPNRYVKYTVPLFLLLWLSALAVRIGRALDRWPIGAAVYSAAWRYRAVAALIAVVGVSVYVARVTHRVMTEANAPIELTREAAFRFLAGLPKDTLIAAHPNDADSIPLRTRRSVLAARETALPFFLGYYDTIKQRLGDELAAYYASTFADADALHERYGATVMLINDKQFSRQSLRLFAPFNGMIRRLFEHGRQSGFALLHPPADRVLFRNRDYCVVRLGPTPQ